MCMCMCMCICMCMYMYMYIFYLMCHVYVLISVFYYSLCLFLLYLFSLSLSLSLPLSLFLFQRLPDSDQADAVDVNYAFLPDIEPSARLRASIANPDLLYAYGYKQTDTPTSPTSPTITNTTAATTTTKSSVFGVSLASPRHKRPVKRERQSARASHRRRNSDGKGPFYSSV